MYLSYVTHGYHGKDVTVDIKIIALGEVPDWKILSAKLGTDDASQELADINRWLHLFRRAEIDKAVLEAGKYR